MRSMKIHWGYANLGDPRDSCLNRKEGGGKKSGKKKIHSENLTLEGEVAKSHIRGK